MSLYEREKEYVYCPCKGLYCIVEEGYKIILGNVTKEEAEETLKDWSENSSTPMEVVAEEEIIGEEDYKYCG